MADAIDIRELNALIEQQSNFVTNQFTRRKSGAIGFDFQRNYATA